MKANNLLYKDIVINLDLLHTWKDKFVPVGIANIILQYKPDFGEWEGYAINLESDNFENKLYQAVDITGQDNLGCLGGYFYINANNT